MLSERTTVIKINTAVIAREHVGSRGEHRDAVVNSHDHKLFWKVHAWIWRLGLIARDPRLMQHEVILPLWHLILSCERIASFFRRMSRSFFGEELGGLLARPFC